MASTGVAAGRGFTGGQQGRLYRPTELIVHLDAADQADSLLSVTPGTPAEQASQEH